MSEGRSLGAVFLARLGGGALDERLERRLTAIVAAARARWPSLGLGAEDLVAELAARIAQGPGGAPHDAGELEEALARVHAEDVYLACACARADPAALAAFEATFFADVDAALARAGVRAAAGDDVKQAVRAKLFVAAPARPPKIAEYSGRGDLKSWFRIVAVREAISETRKAKGRRELLVDDADEGSAGGAGGVAAANDPELVYLRAQYGAEFRSAFAAAVASLSSHERNLLRHHYVERLSIDRIGGLYRIHRMTAARHLTAVRERVVERTREELAARLRVGPRELNSLMRLIKSEVQVTLQRLLG